jgi:hypothetical protein
MDRLELDEDWEEAAAQNSGAELVPDDELEIEELPARNKPKTAAKDQQHLLSALRQVRDYLIELDLESKQSGECLDVCHRVLCSLNGASESLGSEIRSACRELTLACAAARSAGGAPAELALVKQRYDRIASLVPELGGFEAERQVRVKLIVRAILEEVPGLGPLGRSKLEAAGFADVERLCLASQGDLCAAGLTPELAAKILERIARFNRRLNSVPPGADRSAERERLRHLTDTLIRQNLEHDALADEWSKQSAEARRRLRDARSETMSQVSLLLARLGELGTAERIERLPFDKKASELERLLGVLDDTHGQTP